MFRVTQVQTIVYNIMNNQLKTKTRLAFIQIIFQHISTTNNLDEILNMFIENYKGTSVKSFHDKKKIKFEFNSNFLIKLSKFYIKLISLNLHSERINSILTFDRKFEKWDIINQSILIATLSEIHNSEKNKFKIILNDYLNIAKFFISKTEIGTLNAILDKLINEKKF